MLLKSRCIKINKASRKKGITLIEAIISVALLSILLVPISGFAINSLKTNKKAEIKQNASYIGQKTLEELKAYDNIQLKDFSGNKGFKMLDGHIINKQNDGSFSGDFTNSELGENFDVNVTIKNNNDFIYNNVIKMDLELDLTKNNFGSILLSEAAKNNIKMSVGTDYHIRIYEDGSEKYDKELINRNILININSGFDVENFTIEVENEADKSIYIYKNKAEDAKDITINTTKGKVVDKKYSLEGISTIGDLYEIDIVVKKSNEILFQGSTSNNIIFSN